MATTTSGIGLEQFLAMHFEDPEPDFVDGEIIERPMPDTTHAVLMGGLIVALSRIRKLRPLPELRVRLTGRSYIIDVCAYPSDQQLPQYPDTPPIIAIEIASPDDRFKLVFAKLKAYRDWGVPHVWYVDRDPPHFSIYTEHGLIHVPVFEVPEYGVRLTPEELMQNK